MINLMLMIDNQLQFKMEIFIGIGMTHHKDNLLLSLEI
jgi:hypothetical protein